MNLRDAQCRELPASATPVIAVLRAGVLAHAVCAGRATGAVAAVFARSLYVRVDDAFLCLGEASIGNGPLTLIVDGAAGIGALGLHPYDPASILDNAIRIGKTVEFRCDRSKLWRPPGWPAAVAPARLAVTCAVLARRAAVAAPPEGVARLVLAAAPAVTPFARAAASAIAQFQSWLVAALAGDGAPVPPTPVDKLIGLGPGLTPSGDDFLCGALAVLDALAERRIFAALADAVSDAAPALTSPLAACLLRAAAAGHVGERLHDVVAALLAGDPAAAISAAGPIGHTPAGTCWPAPRRCCASWRANACSLRRARQRVHDR